MPIPRGFCTFQFVITQDDVNLYGAHPFYMVCENDGSSHGVFFYNSHSIGINQKLE
jgi:hypothetical protein